MERLKIGFIGGCGHHYLRQVIQPSAGTQLPETQFEVAVAADGHDAAAARRYFESWPVQLATPPRFYGDGHLLLDEFKPDLLSVGAVYGYNADWNIAALERNISVVSDKPIATTWDQLERLRQLISENPRRVLLTEFDFRCRADFRAARAAVAEGLIGDVALVTAQKSYRFGTRPDWYADRTAYGGTLLWIASHAIDAVGFVTGKALETFTGAGGNVSRPAMGSMEDHVAVLGTLAGGGTAVLHADFLRPKAALTHGDDRLRIAGSKGVVEIRDHRAILITDVEAGLDITARGEGAISVGRELLDAALGRNTTYFSTQKSLESAALLLAARDASDGRQWGRFDG